MKTYNIEIQKFKAAGNGNGLVTARVDALVLPLKERDDGSEPTSWISMTEDNARVLVALLKAQLAEIDKRKPKSRRG